MVDSLFTSLCYSLLYSFSIPTNLQADAKSQIIAPALAEKTTFSLLLSFFSHLALNHKQNVLTLPPLWYLPLIANLMIMF
jgi:hypothetical protein